MGEHAAEYGEYEFGLKKKPIEPKGMKCAQWLAGSPNRPARRSSGSWQPVIGR